jgi:hypothetical protein
MIAKDWIERLSTSGKYPSPGYFGINNVDQKYAALTPKYYRGDEKPFDRYGDFYGFRDIATGIEFQAKLVAYNRQAIITDKSSSSVVTPGSISYWDYIYFNYGSSKGSKLMEYVSQHPEFKYDDISTWGTWAQDDTGYKNINREKATELYYKNP